MSWLRCGAMGSSSRPDRGATRLSRTFWCRDGLAGELQPVIETVTHGRPPRRAHVPRSGRKRDCQARSAARPKDGRADLHATRVVRVAAAARLGPALTLSTEAA